MINTKTFIFYDIEAGSLNPKTTQPLSLSAVAICPRKLEIIPNTVFNAFIKPWDEKTAIKKGIDLVQKSALDVNKIKLEDLEDCPYEDTVIRNFAEYLYQFNPKKDSWNAPIQVGFNNNGYDFHIINRMCEMYGYWDDKKNRQKLFSPIQSVDLKDICWLLNENNPEIETNSFDAIRQWLGLDNSVAHTSLGDVLQGAEVFCRCQRLIRYWASKTKFK